MREKNLPPIHGSCDTAHCAVAASALTNVYGDMLLF